MSRRWAILGVTLASCGAPDDLIVGPGDVVVLASEARILAIAPAQNAPKVEVLWAHVLTPQATLAADPAIETAAALDNVVLPLDEYCRPPIVFERATWREFRASTVASELPECDRRIPTAPCAIPCREMKWGILLRL
jgi:hypothetical protein